jgi:hypothetical protein
MTRRLMRRNKPTGIPPKIPITSSADIPSPGVAALTVVAEADVLAARTTVAHVTPIVTPRRRNARIIP